MNPIQHGSIVEQTLHCGNTVTIQPKRFPLNLPDKLNLFLGQDGKAYVKNAESGNPYVLPVGGSTVNHLIRQLAALEGLTLRKNDITEISHLLQAHAESCGIVHPVWYRVAPIEGGIEIDVGDSKHSRIRIVKGNVQVLTEGSETLFSRTKGMLPLVLPADTGDIDLVRKHLNIHPIPQTLLIGWITYVIAHPKLESSKYPILILQGGQGTGKSSACRTILKLVDPHATGIQTMPLNTKDLAIASQHAHVLAYDNLREFKPTMSDALCIASTGGSIASRQLYSDADQSVLRLHAALILNGIHSFISEPDLAQRCVPIELQAIDETKRRSESEMARELEADLPFIMRGLYDLIASILIHQPKAEVTNPERMIDFSRWLAAMELATPAPPGAFQELYSEAIKHGQLDSLLDNTLAAAMLDFSDAHVTDRWTGTPASLLGLLNGLVDLRTQRSREWPLNPIALTKRLKPLQHALMTQGIHVDFARGKERTITITKERK